MAIALSHHHHHIRRFLSSGAALLRRLMSRWPRPAYLLFSLLPLLAAAGCGRSAADQALDRVDAVMETDPELADAMLDSISPGRGADRARHALYRLVATGKLTGAVDNDSLLTLVADRYCTPDAPASRDAMIANFYRGAAYLQAGNGSQAINCLLDAENIGMELSDSLYLSRIYSNMTLLYRLDFNGAKEIEYALKTLNIAPANDSTSRATDNLRVALAYSAARQDSLSWPYYDMAISYARSQKQYDTELASLAGYGVSKIFAGRYHEGVKMLGYLHRLDALPLKNFGDYAWGLFNIGERDNALRLLNEMRESGVADTAVTESYDYYSYLIAKETGDFKTALMLSEKLENSTSSTLDNRLSQTVGETAKTYFQDRLETEIQLKEAQSKTRRMTMMLLLVSCLALILTVYIVINRYRLSKRMASEMIRSLKNDLKNSDNRLKNIEKEHSISVDELSQKLDESMKQTINAEKRAFMAEQSAKASVKILNKGIFEADQKSQQASDEMQRASDTMQQAQDMVRGARLLIDTLQSNIGPLLDFCLEMEKDQTVSSSSLTILRLRLNKLHQILFDDDNPLLYKFLNLAYGSVIDHIRQDIPDMEKETLEIVALAALDFSTSGTAVLLGQSYHKVAKRKSRIKKELASLKTSVHPCSYSFIFEN